MSGPLTPGLLTAAVIAVALIVYTLTGGADYGGGVWDLLARGPRAERQRDLIARTIAPIWEANHVWLILVVVLLFVAFPAAFAAISIALHIPLLLMLIGIVLRGAAFTFRAYGKPSEKEARGWSRLFGVSSALTPLMLGVVLGAVARGIPLDTEKGRPAVDFVQAWAQPFPPATGLFVLALFAFLAAVYLIHDAQEDDLREDFRTRALITGLLLGPLALLAFLLAGPAAPRHLPFHALVAATAIGALAALWRRRYGAARILAAAQASLIVIGWSVAQHPFVLPPDLTLEAAASPSSVLRPVLIALAAGTVILVPAFAWLYVVFRTSPRR